MPHTKLGIAKLLRNSTLQDPVTFKTGYFCIGTSSTAANAFNTALGAEVLRVSLQTSGLYHASGTAIRVHGFFSDGIALGTYREGAVADQSTASGQTLLFHVIYSTPIVKNDAAQSVTLSQTVQVSEVSLT